MAGSLVVYSLSTGSTADGNRVRPDLVHQLHLSLASLRAQDPHQPVVLFVHGPVPRDVEAACRRHGAVVVEQAPYADRLRHACPQGWPALARYPVLHKCLNFSALAQLDLDQVLCLDLDTLVAQPPAMLFERYRGLATVVAREEVFSSRSPSGHDPTFVDEDMLAALGGALRVAPLPPFNLGTVLFDGRRLAELAAVEDLFVDLCWRFVSWMAMHPVAPGNPFAEFQGWHEAASTVGIVDALRALPFPSTNRWLLDEVALWLALAHVPQMTYADFSPADVALGTEFARASPGRSTWTLCHYFSPSLPAVEAWLAHAS